ncbi:MAG TPA: hypothetical protein VH853_10875 [Polyangia bacterium]|nr:hypothetical protein [Polyangia bacterium]
MSTRREKNKKPGVSYASARLGADGSGEEIELPVVDVTHPAFALALTDSELAARVAAFLAEPPPFGKLPPFLRRSLLWFLLRGSVLARGLRSAEGGYLSGLSTYLLKLGPDNLGDAYARPIDRRLAAALPVMAVRLRLQDMATLLADALAHTLAARPKHPLRLVNIAGGPAMDSLNALLVLRRDRPEVLAGRRVGIDVLDLDDAGPAFGARALAALGAQGAPLHGIDVQLRHLRANWTETGTLRDLLRATRLEAAVTAGSSEGGLFEYGTDAEIEANLDCLRDEAPPHFVMVGSVTRADAPMQRLRQTSRFALRPRGLAAFRALAARSGWRIARALERPFSDHVALTRAP